MVLVFGAGKNMKDSNGLFYGQHHQHPAMATGWVVQVMVDQSDQLETNFLLGAHGGVFYFALPQAFVVLFQRPLIGVRSVAVWHTDRYLAFQAQLAANLLPRPIEFAGKPLAPIVGVNPHVHAIEPISFGFMGIQPEVVGYFQKGMVLQGQMVADGTAHRHGLVAIQHHKLPLGEQAQVVEVMALGHPFGFRQGREDEGLQRGKGLCVLGLGVLELEAGG